MANDVLKLEGINEQGYGFIPKSVMTDKNLSIASKGVYAYFCSFTGKGEECFPSRKKICSDLGISNDSLGKYVKQLVENGYLKVEQVKEKGKFSHNVYTLPYRKLPCPKISVTENSVSEELDTNNNNNKNNNIYNKNNSIYIAPTLHEVEEYCLARNSCIDAKRFYDYYDANGWKDAAGREIKNWKQKVISWEMNNNEKHKGLDKRKVKRDGSEYAEYD